MTQPPLRHADTEARATGFDAVLESAFERIRQHGRQVAIGLGVVLVLGTAAAIAYDSARRAENAASSALARIESEFSAAMGAPLGVAIVPEPANEALARRAREAALARFDELIAEHEGSEAARIAAIRAAEMEVDLGRLEAAVERLTGLDSSLDPDDLRRPLALRLKAYVHEEQAQPLAAAEALERASQVESYPGRALLLVAAGDAYERAAAYRRAIAAYQRALSITPELAQQSDVIGRIATLEYIAEAAEATAAEPPGPSGSDKEYSVK